MVSNGKWYPGMTIDGVLDVFVCSLGDPLPPVLGAVHLPLLLLAQLRPLSELHLQLVGVFNFFVKRFTRNIV